MTFDNIHQVLSNLQVPSKDISKRGMAYYDEKGDSWYYLEENENGTYEMEKFAEEPSKLNLT